MEVREKSCKWFEVTVEYDKTQENGEVKKTTDVISIDAMSFTEAEARAFDAYNVLCSNGSLEIKAIKIARYKNVLIPIDSNVAPVFYNATISCITLDEKTAKEKKTPIKFLVGATNHEDAERTMKKIVDVFVGECVIVGITESKVVEIYEHD